MITREQAKQSTQVWMIVLDGILKHNTSIPKALEARGKILCACLSPENMALTNPFYLYDFTKTLNYGMRRARLSVAMSQVWILNSWHNVLDLPGINRTALDELAILEKQLGLVSLSKLDDSSKEALPPQ